MKQSIQLVLIGFSLLLSAALFAQDKTMDPVTLVASARAENTSETGRDIVVVRGEQLQRLPVHSLDELLRYLPGVEIQQRGVMGSQADIVLRGATFGQVLVILDGVRVNDPNTGHFSAYIPIAPAEIDRVEILKGASSALYGSEAVGGVINIVSRSFAAKNKGAQKEISAGGSMGEYGLVSANAGGFYRSGGTSVGAGLQTTNSTGQPARGTRGFFHNNTASASLHQFLAKHWSFGFRSAYDDRNFCAQNFYTSFVSDTAQEHVKTWLEQASLNYQKGDDALSIVMAYRSTKDQYTYNSGLSPNQNTSGLSQAGLNWQHRFSASTSLVTGGQYLLKTIESNDRGDHRVSQGGVFLLLDQRFGALKLTPALRLEMDQRAGAELVPGLNLSYGLRRLQLRGSLGRTVRQPDFTERYNNYNKSLVTSGSIGNPDLKMERSFSFEAGADFYPIEGVKLSATGFRRNGADVIDWVNTSYPDMPRKDNLSPSGSYALASNVADVHTTGVDGSLQWERRLTSQQHLSLMLGATWLHTTTSEAAASFYILSHAKLLVNGTAGYSLGSFSLHLTGIYKRRAPMVASPINVKLDGECFMMNGKASYQIDKGRFQVFFEVDDLFNASCRDLIFSLQPRRWMMGGIQMQILK